MSLCKPSDPWARPDLPQGSNVNTVDSGLPDKATYQISKALAF